MIYKVFEEFVEQLPEGRALLGVDLGTKTIGIAVSDVERKIATPHYTIRRKEQKKDLGRIWQITLERDVCGVVIGMPTNMDGSDGPRSQSTRAFARSLEAYLPKPIAFWDERLSTVHAERVLLEADTSRQKRELVIDKVAASVILQGALDRIAFINGTGTVSDDEPVAPAVKEPDEEEAPPVREKAGRRRADRKIEAKGGPAESDLDPGETAPGEERPKPDAETVRRRRLMTRRIDPGGSGS